MAKPPVRMDRDEGLITILSIDGGGMRGVIPGFILATLEDELQKLNPGEDVRIVDFFDYIAGTSTGGIVTAMLTTPSHEAGHRPRAATEINQFYRHRGPLIFSEAAKSVNVYGYKDSSYVRDPEDSMWKKVAKGVIALGRKAVNLSVKLGSPKYEERFRLEQISEVVGDIMLANTLTNVVIPAYNVENLHPVIFSTPKAKKNEGNVALKHVIMGTTAAPTYFSAYSAQVDGGTNHLVDGGMAANNPTLFALREAAREDERWEDSKILVISLGTGSAKFIKPTSIPNSLLGWISTGTGMPLLVDVLFRSSDDVIDMSTALVLDQHHSSHNFLRIQDFTLNPDKVEMDDPSQENIDAMEEMASELLQRPRSWINPETGLLQEAPPDASGRVPTNYEALADFAQRLSNERNRRRC